MSKKSKNPGKKLDRLAVELVKTIKGVSSAQRRKHANGTVQGNPRPDFSDQRRDRIDVLVDALDEYYFRIGGAYNELSGSTWVGDGDYSNIKAMFETKRLKEDREAFHKVAAKSGMASELESAVYQWLTSEEDFFTLLGFILGLRIAGIPSETAKGMAKTWRVGPPQDD